MKKRVFGIGLVLAVLIATVGLVGCSNSSGSSTKLQDKADLEWVTIGTIAAVWPDESGTNVDAVLAETYDAKEIQLSSAQAGAAISVGLTAASDKAKVEFARVPGGVAAEIETFSTATTGRTFDDGDMLVIKVTSQDGKTAKFYRVNISLGRNAFLASVTIGRIPHLAEEEAYLGVPAVEFDDIEIGSFQTDQIIGMSRLIAPAQDEAAEVSYVLTTGEPTALPADETFVDLVPAGILVSTLNLDLTKEDYYLIIKVVPTKGDPLYYIMNLVFPRSGKITYGVPKLVDPDHPEAPFYIDPIWEDAEEFIVDRANQSETVASYFRTETAAGRHTQAKVKALWDDGGIWVLAEVDVSQFNDGTGMKSRPISPGNEHAGDSIEVFINERLQILDPPPLGSVDDIGNQFRVGVLNDRSGRSSPAAAGDTDPTLAPFNAATYAKTRTVLKNATGDYVEKLEDATNGGYLVIMYSPFKFKASANANDVFDTNGDVREDAQIGFELQFNTAVSSARDGILTWSGYTTQAYGHASGYGVVTLDRASKPKDTKAFPEITAQALSNGTYEIDATAVALSVTTSGSVQWFSSTTQFGAGTAISGETNATFTPPTDDSLAGTTTYYYAVVTANNVAVVTDRRAAIRVLGVGESNAIPQDPYDLAAYDTVTLNNNAHAIYRFILPEGSKYGDYSTITVKYRVADVTDVKFRSGRLYGAIPETSITIDNTGIDAGPAYTTHAINNDWIMDDFGVGNGQTDWTKWAIDSTPTNNTWFTITYQLDGSSNNNSAISSGFHKAVPADNETFGPFYFGVGLSGVDGTPITSDIGVVTLVHKTDPAKNVVSGGSGFDKPAFMCYEDATRAILTRVTHYEDANPTVRAVGNGTLFSAVGSYSTGQKYEYPASSGVYYWIVSDCRHEKTAIATKGLGDGIALDLAEAIFDLQVGYSADPAGYTRIAYEIDSIDASWDDYAKVSLTYDCVPLWGTLGLLNRDNKGGAGSGRGTDGIAGGIGKTVTFNTSDFGTGGISFTKGGDDGSGAFLFRVTKIELHD